MLADADKLPNSNDINPDKAVELLYANARLRFGEDGEQQHFSVFRVRGSDSAGIFFVAVYYASELRSDDWIDHRHLVAGFVFFPPIVTVISVIAEISQFIAPRLFSLLFSFFCAVSEVHHSL